MPDFFAKQLSPGPTSGSLRVSEGNCSGTVQLAKCVVRHMSSIIFNSASRSVSANNPPTPSSALIQAISRSRPRLSAFFHSRATDDERRCFVTVSEPCGERKRNFEGGDIAGIDLRKRAVPGARVVFRWAQPLSVVLFQGPAVGLHQVTLLGCRLLQKLLRRQRLHAKNAAHGKREEETKPASEKVWIQHRWAPHRRNRSMSRLATLWTYLVLGNGAE